MTPRTSRRVLLAGGGSLAAAVAGGLVLRERAAGRAAAPVPVPVDASPSDGAPSDPAAPADPPGSWAAVNAEALATTGLRLRGSPWERLVPRVTDWSAVYVCWLLRGAGVAPTADVAGLWAGFVRQNRTGTRPQPGALIFYSRGDVDRPDHVGLVHRVSGGLPETVEGNAPATVVAAERFVRRFAYPWSSRVRYAYPRYA